MDWIDELTDADREKAEVLMRARERILDSQQKGDTSRDVARIIIHAITEELERIHEKSKRKDYGVYACYRGDNYLFDGTLPEIAERLGWKVASVRWLTYPVAQKRSNGYRKDGKPKERITLVKL